MERGRQRTFRRDKLKFVLLLQKTDHVFPLLRFGDVEIHIVPRDKCVGIGKPLVKRGVVPDQMRISKRVRVREVRNVCRSAAIDIVQPRPFAILVERVATGAATFEDGFASRWIAIAGGLRG